MAEFEKRQNVAEAEKSALPIKNNAATLISTRSQQVVVGNPQGDVTLVEFFDYNCGYCKQALADMNDADEGRRQAARRATRNSRCSVRVRSRRRRSRSRSACRTRAARNISISIRRLLGGRGQADKARALAVAKDVGADMARLETDLTSPEVKATLEENFKLAEQLGLNGTPSYVVGNEIVVGAVGLATLRKRSSRRAGRARADRGCRIVSGTEHGLIHAADVPRLSGRISAAPANARPPSAPAESHAKIDLRPERSKPQSARHSASRKSTAAPPSPTSRSCAAARQRRTASTSSSANRTTRAIWSTGCRRRAQEGRGVIINPGAFTHTSIAILDAVIAIGTAGHRNAHLQHSCARGISPALLISKVAKAVICGFGIEGYGWRFGPRGHDRRKAKS